MDTTYSTLVCDRQDPLRKHYKHEPKEALISDRAKTSGGVETDPFHGVVHIGDEAHAATVPFGIHRAVGGFHDKANPGDMLCAAVAACLDATLRIIASRLKVKFKRLEVEVVAHADVRGTLLVDDAASVGFYNIECRIDLQPETDCDEKMLRSIVAAAEKSCVNLQTLTAGVAVETTLNIAG